MTQAVIEFNLDGTIITANDSFLKAMGYTLEEIKGQPHSVLVDPADHASAEFKQFWCDINDGKPRIAEFKRLRMCGQEVWIQASYHPILSGNGTQFNVVKFVMDITESVKQRTVSALHVSKAENSPIDMMFENKDFETRFMKPASTRTLKSIKQFLPIPAEKMLGRNIDVVH